MSSPSSIDGNPESRTSTHLSVASTESRGRLPRSAIGSLRDGVSRSRSRLRQAAATAAEEGSLRSGLRVLVSGVDSSSIPWAEVLVLASTEGDEPSVSMGICPIVATSNGLAPSNLVLIKHNIKERGNSKEPVYETARRELDSLVTSLSESPCAAMSETELTQHKENLTFIKGMALDQQGTELMKYYFTLHNKRQQKLVADQPTESVLKLSILSPTEVPEAYGEHQGTDPSLKCRLQPELVSNLWRGGQSCTATDTAGAFLTDSRVPDSGSGGVYSDVTSASRLMLEFVPPHTEEDNRPWSHGLSSFRYQSSVPDPMIGWNSSEICPDKPCTCSDPEKGPLHCNSQYDM